jgi:hypothetical protein
MAMNKDILHTVKSVMGCLLMASLAAGCAQEDIGTTPTGGGGMSASSYVSFSFASLQGAPTRSNPMGGEIGDGLEKGQDYENDITSAVAFFYQTSEGNGVNSGGNTTIKAVVEFNTINKIDETQSGVDRIYATGAKQVDLENGTYNVIVVANPGTDWWTGRSLKLADVRDHIHTAAWTASESGYSNFVMTSAADAMLTLNSNPEDDPATAEVNVERMAARLDYKAEASYTCTDPKYSGATVEITGAALVNNLTAGSYLLKRVADDVKGTNLSYLGDETADENDVATNYVLDPWTTNKSKDLYGEWFGNISQDPNYWAAYVQPGTSVSDGWQRIGYTLENTTAAEEAGKRYSTGVVFKAKFHPQGVANYEDGATFFALGTHLFASMENMMTYVYGADFSQFDAKIDACTDWASVKTFAASLLDNDPSGYKTFLQGQDDTQDLAQVKESLKWKAYMFSNCGYSASLNNNVYSVILDQNEDISTREALQPYGTRTYEDATCYYTWWVRHSNDNDDTKKGIMEYAIVRNNIYKLTVNSVYSLGGEVPEEESLIVDVYVNDWLLLDPETLPM